MTSTLRYTESTTTVCVHEDRPDCLVGLKLTVLSLRHCCPDLPIIVSCPDPPISLCKWISAFSNVQIVSYPEFIQAGWNVKPAILLRLIEAGWGEVIWIDSDIIVHRDFLKCLSDLDSKTLLVTEESYWEEQFRGTYRTIAWGLEPYRAMSTLVNTGIVRVTPYHVKLLQAWQALLLNPAYLKAQHLPESRRPRHMYSDQEALSALLGSTDFSDIPFKMLKRGKDIAQCIRASGFTPFERMCCLWRGLPMFIHAMYKPKPWNRSSYPATIWHSGESLTTIIRKYLFYISLELSPYLSIARKYRQEMEEDVGWMELHSIPAKLLAVLFANHPALQGLPLALLDSGLRRASRIFKRKANPFDSPFILKDSPLKVRSY